MGEEGIFSGLTAWFSKSVRKKRRQLWEKEGGETTHVDSAQFLFSENADSTDTIKIFNSQPYEDEHLSVFHSMYIDKCAQLGSTSEVMLGDYFLPPTDIQQLVRKQKRYKWELDEAADPEEESSESEEQVEDGQPGPSTSSPSGNPEDTGGEDIKNLPKYEGPLTEFLPGQNGNQVFCVS